MTDSARELNDAIHAAAELQFWRVPEVCLYRPSALGDLGIAPKPENRAGSETVAELRTVALRNRRVPHLRPPGQNWVLAPERFLIN
jgi:hypothetical protein